MRLLWYFGLLVSAAGVPALGAQEISLMLGGTHARYADSLSGTAGMASARLQVLRPLHALTAQVGLSRFTGGEWAVQTSVQGAAFFPLSRRFAWGIAGGGNLNDFEGGSLSGTVAVGPLLVASSHRVFLSFGASGGAVRSVDEITRTLGTGTIRVHVQATPDAAVDAGVVATAAQDGITYGDITGGITWYAGPVTLAASAGARVGDLEDEPWIQGRLEWSPVRFAQLEAAGGRYPRDLTGFTDGLFLQAGVRLQAGHRPRMPVSVGQVPRPVRATRLSGSAVRVTVVYPKPVRALAIAGDFSAWEPVPMRRTGSGVWSVELDLPAGLHQYSLVADGQWTLPDGVAAIDDGFGGAVAVLIVSR